MDLIEQLKIGSDKNLQDVASNRAIAEILGQMAIAQRFPRDLGLVHGNCLKLCENVKLAELAGYSIPRKGSKNVEGPSIRLLEMVAGEFRNLNYGIKTEKDDFDDALTQYTVFALDLEKNLRIQRTFSTRHIRYTKKGTFKLTKDQEIYESVSNQATRRLRVCLEQIIPKWLVNDCYEKCKQVIQSAKLPSPDKNEAIISAFGAYSITKLQIEDKIGKPLEKATPEDVNKLRLILNGIKSEGIPASDYFEYQSKFINILRSGLL